MRRAAHKGGTSLRPRAAPHQVQLAKAGWRQLAVALPALPLQQTRIIPACTNLPVAHNKNGQFVMLQRASSARLAGGLASAANARTQTTTTTTPTTTNHTT